MYDTISDKNRNHFYNHNEAGAKPDPYNPDWVKTGGEWYYKGNLHAPISGAKITVKPEKLTVKGELAWSLSQKTGKDFETLNSKAYTTAQLREELSGVLKSEMADKK